MADQLEQVLEVKVIFVAVVGVRTLYLSTKNRSAATTLSSAVFDRYGTTPRSFGATFWNPGVKTEKTAKKREKTGQKWARYGLRKRVRVADLFVMDRYSGEYNGKQKHEPDLEAVVARAGAAGDPSCPFLVHTS